MNVKAYGGSQIFKWTHEYLLKLLTTGSDPILTDPILINAFRSVKRADFVPESYSELAYLDKEVDLGYNEKLERPTVTARMLSLLQPKVGGKYLDLGSGSGYFAALLGKAVGNSGEVFSIERIQWLWETCRVNLQNYPEIRNIKFLYRNGSDGMQDKAPFDGIHVSFDISGTKLHQLEDKLKNQLKLRTGLLVYPSGLDIKLVQRLDIDEYVEEIVPGFVFNPMQEGLA